MKEVRLSKDKIVTHKRVSELMLAEMDLSVGQFGGDFMINTFTIQLEAFILSQINEKKTITVYRERPTFWEWLTRKPRSFTFEFSAKEVLKNPPSLPPGKSVMMYAVNELTTE